MEALPVDIVPVESITQIQQGDKKAPMAVKAAPKPTKRPDPVADAQNVGENAVDLKASESAKESPKEVVSQAPPKAVETPIPTPEPEPKPAEKVAKAEPTPTPEPVTPPKPVEKPVAKTEPAPLEKPTEVASLPAETTPDPVAEAIEQAKPAEPESPALPTAGPVPEARPKPVETAAVTPAKETPKPVKPAKPAEAASGSSKKSDFNADEVAALLNKQDSSGGGAKRSTEVASLGGSKTTSGETLSQSEMDALRGQIQKFWNIIPGMADGGDVRVIVKMRLDPSGNIIGDPEVSATGGAAGTRGTLAGSAKRAVLRAQPYQLPAEKYDTWSEVVVNFDPSQMF